METMIWFILCGIAGFEYLIWERIKSKQKYLLQITDEKNYELMNWMLFQEKWDGNPNNVLYAWRCVLLDLKQSYAPIEQIEALEKKCRAEKERLTKDRMMVTSSGEIRKYTMVGGKA